MFLGINFEQKLINVINWNTDWADYNELRLFLSSVNGIFSNNWCFVII